jgi:hypothetical protein
MGVAVAMVAATTPLLIYSLRCLLAWKLGKEALEKNASMKIGGLNPLAPSVEIVSNTELKADGPAALAETDSNQDIDSNQDTGSNEETGPNTAQHRPDSVA